MNLPDLWSKCYDGEQRQRVSPEEFRSQFCDNCMNGGCRNSKASKTTWSERISTQADRLLHNPQFSDPRDPRYREYAEMQFVNKLREALAIEVSTRKGDWTPVTEEEIGRAAAEMVGMVPPSGFQAPKLVDEVTTTGLDGKEQAPPPAQSAPPPEPEVPPEPPEELEGKWVLRGDSGNLYTVTLTKAGDWGCTCPSREVPCKHARDIQQKLRRAAPEAPKAPEAPPLPPGLPPVQGNAPEPFSPRDGRVNTGAPTQGIMIGGGPPPAPEPEVDPWAPAPAKPKERVMPVGGRVTFGARKKKG